MSLTMRRPHRAGAALAVASAAALAPAAAGAAPGNASRAGMESTRLYGNINKYAYYFTELMVGSPEPQKTSVIVDTGSRLVGFPCRGCEHCGANHLDPVYDLGRSESFRWLGCTDSCFDICTTGRCTYQETYSEGSSIAGAWFQDVVQLGEGNPAVTAKMGCHNSENKLFFTQRANGIMGLAPSAGGPSVLQDLFRDKKHIKTSIFSLCFATWGGLLTVGGYDPTYHAAGNSITWSELLASHYYFVYPVGVKMLALDGHVTTIVAPGTGDHFGASILDSGTTYTYLPSALYNAMSTMLFTYCNENNGCGGVQEGSCWALRDGSRSPTEFPKLVFVMKGGGEIIWEPQHYMQERDEVGNFCLTFKANNMFQTVLGLSWMLSKDIIFDIEQGRLGVATANCPESHISSDYLLREEVAEDRHIHVAAPVGVWRTEGRLDPGAAAAALAPLASSAPLLGALALVAALALAAGGARWRRAPASAGPLLRTAASVLPREEGEEASIAGGHAPWNYKELRRHEGLGGAGAGGS